MRQILLITLLLSQACSTSEELENPQHQGKITRQQDQPSLLLSPPTAEPLPPYPWEAAIVGAHPKITKDFFRCKGSPLNPRRTEQPHLDQDPTTYADCGGIDKHGLPVQNNEEFIYPILPELLNYIQAKTGKRVVITSGHRCPTHNTYADPSTQQRTSKHMIGAEVDFYVQGMEEQPEALIDLLFQYYQEHTTIRNDPEFTEFKRYTKPDTNVSTLPWYNREVFIKLFKKDEGRDYDNRHPYPYVSIQVRRDRQTNQRVNYTWETAQHYRRHW